MTAEEKAFTETSDSYRQKFDDAMDDDLNTADAIGVIFEAGAGHQHRGGEEPHQGAGHRLPGYAA
ncbi:MAG: DALR domain-containing protein [Evtepia sp.]